ncbi:NADH-quinone oxidoreductase subunit L [Streptomyces sp. NL15-2K]|uniref:NADH-quinone oxidoreductase subunit 5 family protein n=1 Tax=Streptomyces sp. NL15-2K TaxID=376149 RepID=UPI000F56D27A|nr:MULTISPECIES: proton-conducting transporter membrane subunit [Actinomycetes]WKX06835.1 proton-conducting transporter membrane subunit [Kutzneria buriramensis]GCB43846.1 NADH-ubiquinone oxidoreductase chain L [Streptomyces sp. NL15-2K]
MSGLLWVLVTLPLGVGALLLVAGRRADRMAPGVALTVTAAALGLAVSAAFRHPSVSAPFLDGLPVEFTVDGLSGVLAVTVCGVTLAVLLFSAVEFGAREARARFFGLMLLFAGSMLATVTAATLPVLLMGWEVMGATSWALIGYWWRDPRRTSAADTAFLTTRTADLGLYLAAGAALAAGHDPTLSLDGLARADDPWLSFVTAGVIAAALGKSAQLPFSFWLSKAMQGPSPVSALLHSATMVVAGAYLLLRTGPLLDASGWGDDLVAWTGAATALCLGLVATAQTDLKQLLAASSCAQIGFMVLAAGADAPSGGTLQLIAHAAAKSLLFLGAGAWLTALGTQRLPELLGAARRNRTVGVAFTVAALSLAGVPPLSLWAAKDVLLAGALESSPWLYAVGLAAALLSAVYSAKALWYVWQRPVVPRPDGRRVPGGVVPPLVLLALACVALTPLAFPPLRDSVGRVLAAPGQTVPLPWEFVLSGALALLAGAATWAWGSRPLALPGSAKSALLDWLHLERAAHRLLVAPVMRLARAAAAFDDRVLDRAVDGSATVAVRFARWTDGVVERAVDGSVTALAAGTRALGRSARRPQTGQLHQYLAQAVAAFTVLAVVLVLVR